MPLPRPASASSSVGLAEDPLAAPAERPVLEHSSSFVNRRTDSIREQLLLNKEEGSKEDVSGSSQNHHITEDGDHMDPTSSSSQEETMMETILQNNPPISSEEGDPPTPQANSSTSTSAAAAPSSCWTFPGAVVNLCSATLGAGVLSLPHACREAGLIASTLLLLGAALATVYSIRVVVQACTYYQLYTYESLAEVLYGPRLRRLVELAIVVFCQGCAVAYMIAVADILEQAHLLIQGSRAISMIVVWALVLLPLSSLRTMTALQMSSAVGIASIGTLVFAALIHLLDDGAAAAAAKKNGEHNTTALSWFAIDQRQQQQQQPIFLGNLPNNSSTIPDENEIVVDWYALLWPQNGLVSIMTACPIILFAFSCQVNVCAIYEELPASVQQLQEDSNTATTTTTTNQSTPPQSSAKESFMHRVTMAAVSVCALLYASVSLICLADFGVYVTPNMLNAYSQPLAGIMQVAAVGMVLAVTMAFPLNIFPARVTLEGICAEHKGRLLPSLKCCSHCCGGREDRSAPDATLTAALLEDQDTAIRDPEVPSEDDRTPLNRSDQVHNDGSNRDLADDYPSFSWTRHFALTLILAGSALGLALVAPNISIVFQIIGGTASSLLGFGIPGWLGLRLGRDLSLPRTTTVWSWLLLYGGIVIGVGTTAVTVYQIVDPGGNN